MLKLIIIIAIFGKTLSDKTRRLLQFPFQVPVQVQPGGPPPPQPANPTFPGGFQGGPQPPQPPPVPANPNPGFPGHGGAPPVPVNPGIPGAGPVGPVPANPGGIQFAPVPILGAYGQSCGPVGGSFVCLNTNQVLTDQATGMVDCTNDFSCCLCKTITCGYSPGVPCTELVAGGANALFGVEQIAIQGRYMGQGAVLDCQTFKSCAKTKVIGNWVDTVNCGDQFSCQEAEMELSASNGVTCGREGCVDAKFTMKTNRGGDITCGGLSGCKGATFDINGGVEIIGCGGVGSCVGATITITNPSIHFLLSCGGRESCRGLTLNIIIPEPLGGCPATGLLAPRFMEWKGISCGANDACRDLIVNVQNDGCNPILMDELTCQAGGSCTGMIIDFHKGKSKQDLFIQNCLCGPSCQTATGIDKCYNNVRIIECLNPFSCGGVQHLSNVANGFLLLCAAESSCQDYTLNIDISGWSQNIVRSFTGIDCGAPKACKGLKVALSNTQYDHLMQPVTVKVGAIICSATTACDNAEFITGDYVEITQVVCITADACNNCTVKKYPGDVGKDCFTPIALPAPPVTTAASATAAGTTAATTAAAMTTTAAATTTANVQQIPIIPIPLTPITTSNANAQPVTTANIANPEPPVVNIPMIPITNIPPVSPQNTAAATTAAGTTTAATTAAAGAGPAAPATPTTTLSLLEFLAKELGVGNKATPPAVPIQPGVTEPIATAAATTVPIPKIPRVDIPPVGIVPPFLDPPAFAATTTTSAKPVGGNPVIPQIKIGTVPEVTPPKSTQATGNAPPGPPLI